MRRTETIVAGVLIVGALLLGGAMQAGAPPREGRYQIVLGTISGKQSFLLDTDKGVVWELVDFSDRNGKYVETAWRELRKYPPKYIEDGDGNAADPAGVKQADEFRKAFDKK